MTQVSAVIVSYRSLDSLEACLQSLRAAGERVTRGGVEAEGDVELVPDRVPEGGLEAFFFLRPASVIAGKTYAMVFGTLRSGGCGAFENLGGGKKTSPDEFKIVSHSPLTMPPNAELRPPRPGEPRPQEVTPADQAKEALSPALAGRPQRNQVLTGTSKTAPTSSEQALGGLDIAHVRVSTAVLPGRLHPAELDIRAGHFPE